MVLIKSAKEHPTTSMAIIVVAVCALRFLFDGVIFSIAGHIITIPHVDPLSYGSILTPVLAAHGYLRGKIKQKEANDAN
jgi:hypothetical protein